MFLSKLSHVFITNMLFVTYYVNPSWAFLCIVLRPAFGGRMSMCSCHFIALEMSIAVTVSFSHRHVSQRLEPLQPQVLGGFRFAVAHSAALGVFGPQCLLTSQVPSLD